MYTFLPTNYLCYPRTQDIHPSYPGFSSLPTPDFHPPTSDIPHFYPGYHLSYPGYIHPSYPGLASGWVGGTGSFPVVGGTLVTGNPGSTTANSGLGGACPNSADSFYIGGTCAGANMGGSGNGAGLNGNNGLVAITFSWLRTALSNSFAMEMNAV